MIIANLNTRPSQQQKKTATPRRIVPFRFKTFQSETNGHWTTIGKSLTNRYHKFHEDESKNTIAKEFSVSKWSELPNLNKNLDVGLQNREIGPRFEIKRKYLSFNPEKLEKRTITSLKTEYPTIESQQRISLNNSIIFDKSKQMPLVQTSRQQNNLSGTYFIPKSKNTYQKLKYILYKKGKKRNIANPQLQVKTKYKEKKQNFQLQRRKKLQMGNGRKQKEKRYKSLQKQQHYFRPWSSSKQQQL